MNDLRLDMPLTTAEIGLYLGELNEIRGNIAIMNIEPGNPGGMARKVSLYIDLQHVIGELYAQTVYDYNMAVLARKNAFAEARELVHGSEKDKDAAAEIMTKAEREAEAKHKSNLKRWEMQYNNCEQKANSLKKEYEVLFDDYRFRAGKSGG